MVEWKKLGEVCKVLRGKRLTKSQLNESEGYPVLHGGSTPMGYYEEFNRKANTTVVVNTGNAGCVFFYDKEFWSSDACFSLYPNKEIIDKFLYLYVYGCERILKGKIRAGAMPTIDAKAVEDLLIPIPSLSEQQRIVSILDTFTSSISNLKQQIEERRKQYEYERDLLLDLEGKEGVEMKKLEEVVSSDCSLSYGIVQPGDDVADGVPVVRPVDLISNYVKLDGLKKTERLISESYKKTILKGNEILFCVRGTTGIMGLATNELKGCNVTRGIVPISFDDEITKMFVYYQLKCFRLQKVIDEKTNGTALKQINIKDLRLLNLFFPPLSTQSRIVSILDTFEQSIANLEEQLAMREKQYEYYRNQLLTFEGEEERGKT